MASLVDFLGGTNYRSLELPSHYVPRLLSAQFTEPVLLAAPIGLYFALRLYRRKEFDRSLFLVILFWFLIPFSAQLILDVPIYGNIRHLLFMTVPLLIFAGLGWSSIIQRLNRRWAQGLVLLLALAPGIFHIIRFHPYQYVYYNAFLGGVREAQGRYELDHWCTSYRELMEFVNENALPDSRVAVYGPVEAASEFARPDLDVGLAGTMLTDPDYALACDYAVLDEHYFATYHNLFEVVRGGVVLGRVKSAEMR